MASGALSGLVSDRSSQFSPKLYDALYGQFAPFNETLARICAALTGAVSPDKIVELGCGSGLFSAAVVKAFEPRAFIGVDPSAAMLENAAARLPAFGVQLECDLAQNALSKAWAQSADLVVIKSAFHHFEHGIAFENLLDLLTDDGHLVLVERTARSAASYPVFDEARDSWEAYFSRRAVRPEHPSIVSRCTFGEYVRLTASDYYDAIGAGQLSFTWSFDQRLVSEWVAQIRANLPTFVDVYEEYEVQVFRKTRPRTGQR